MSALPARFLAPGILVRFRGYIGVAYFLLGTAINVVAEDGWAPRNYYDESRHILLETREVCDDDEFQQHCAEVPDVWKDKRSGAVFHDSSFDAVFRRHRRAQIPGVFVRETLYALGGSLLYAYLTAVVVPGDFVRRLRRGLGFGAAFVAATVALLW